MSRMMKKRNRPVLNDDERVEREGEEQELEWTRELWKPKHGTHRRWLLQHSSTIYTTVVYAIGHMKRSVEDMAAAVISKMPSMAPPVSDEDAARELLAHCRHSSSKPLTTDEFTFPVVCIFHWWMYYWVIYVSILYILHHSQRMPQQRSINDTWAIW